VTPDDQRLIELAIRAKDLLTPDQQERLIRAIEEIDWKKLIHCRGEAT
jgi:hypothetical protein